MLREKIDLDRMKNRRYRSRIYKQLGVRRPWFRRTGIYVG